MLNVFAPPDHHRASSFNVIRTIVGAAHLIFVHVRKCDLDQLGVPSLFVQDGTGHGAHAMAHQATFKAHPFQGHVCRLAIAVSPWVSVGWKYVLSVAAVRFDRL